MNFDLTDCAILLQSAAYKFRPIFSTYEFYQRRFLDVPHLLRNEVSVVKFISKRHAILIYKCNSSCKLASMKQNRGELFLDGESRGGGDAGSRLKDLQSLFIGRLRSTQVATLFAQSSSRARR